MSTVSYGYFHFPEHLKAKEVSDTYGEFEWSPFERGFGYTIGNSIRRILLSSIAAPAIISIKISPFLHEFMAADGIVEDMVDISLNFKEVLLKLTGDIKDSSIKEIVGSFEITEDDIKNSSGKVEITAGDIVVHDDIEVVNTDKILFTCIAPQSIDFKIKFTLGRGYVPVEKNPLVNQVEDAEVLLDGLFSPVKISCCKVENTRVGSSTDYDKVVFNIETDGRITPLDALSHSFQIAKYCFDKIENFSFESNIVISDRITDDQEGDEEGENAQFMHLLSKKISEMDFTVRASNCLKEAGIMYFGELLLTEEENMLEIKNLGKKSLDELRAKIQEQGQESAVYLYFGMDLLKYGVDKENARDVLSDFYKENKI
ncbi:MAG: DNA-directed RNA polymerase subunit alpha [Chlamydiia bacterium]|nr:DNA-directed RNA polymerase subunit alpha [Chlamydiia bacterium]